MNNDKCPCRECITLAICKAKQLINCSILYDYAYVNNFYDRTYREEKIIKAFNKKKAIFTVIINKYINGKPQYEARINFIE